MRLMTTRGYVLSEVVSALQKAIRRGDVRLAGYFAIEMHESNFGAYAFRRLLTVSAEDCHGILTAEVRALYEAWLLMQKTKKGKGRVFLAKAVVLLCHAKKSRDADHLSNLLYDPQAIDEKKLERALDAARATATEIPEYAYDVHTGKGARRGKTRRDFFLEEHDALKPREPGFFDDDVEELRAGRRDVKPRPKR